MGSTAVIEQLFETLNTPEEKRQKTLPQHFAEFAYINGKLFSEQLSIASFDSDMRESLLNATALNWGYISPAIFGSLFQGVMDDDVRRNLGAHYTTEANILKVVKPLFLDKLWSELKKCRTNKKALQRFHEKISTLKFFDPACGCGNFLVITYRELRLLELEVLLKLNPKTGLGWQQSVYNISVLIQVNVDQFYGIELEEFPAQIAQVALWLTDHQMNIKVSEAFGLYFTRLPLTTSPRISNCNALTTLWEDVVDPKELDYILGNPPFGGSKYQSREQRAEIRAIATGVRRAGILDYVSGWYLLASEYIQDTNIEVGFVSTNSITQGEQVGSLWPMLIDNRNIKINFGHRTFEWTSEARGRAAVHCVIIGFSLNSWRHKILFDYDTVQSEPKRTKAKNINPYLVDGPSIVLHSRVNPICSVPHIGIGNKPIDNGNYLFTPEEKDSFLLEEPKAKKYFNKWIGAREYLNNIDRWCLWLGDCPPHELRKMSKCMELVENVKNYRLNSTSKQTRTLADTPTRFHVENMPEGNYLVIPGVSSLRREYIPIGYMSPDVMASNLVNISSSADLFHLGVLSSTMHMAWVRYTAGRLKSDYRYSVRIVYNNYPWPQKVTRKKIKSVQIAAKGVLEARATFPDSALSDMYDPISMPPVLRRAHNKLDKAVDLCYRSQPFPNELNRVSYLFGLYEKLI